jgi:alpha-tubulin suppressor-like RCC1 family protein
VYFVDIKNEMTGVSLKTKQISCGAVFSVALTQTDEIYAWGSNNNGQMGTGSGSS